MILNKKYKLVVAGASGYAGSSANAKITCESSTAIKSVLIDDGAGYQVVHVYTNLSIGDSIFINSGGYSGCIVGIY